MEASPLNFAAVERLRRVGCLDSAEKRNKATDDVDNERREEEMAEAMTTMI